MTIRTLRNLALASTAAVAALTADETVTTHNDNGGGRSNTVTVFLGSRTVLDRGLLGKLPAGLVQVPMGADELWQHGHSKDQLLRVVTAFKRTGAPAAVACTRVGKGDTIEVEIAKPRARPARGCKLDGGRCYTDVEVAASAVIGTLQIKRLAKPGAGYFTNGHLFDEKAELSPCIGGPRLSPEDRLTKLKEALDGLAAGRGAASAGCLKEHVAKHLAAHGGIADIDLMWAYRAVASQSGLGFTWDPLDPLVANPKGTVVDQLCKTKFPGKYCPTPAVAHTNIAMTPHSEETTARFEFQLKPSDGSEVVFRDLRVVRSGAGPAFRARIPAGAEFTICKNNEATGLPECPPIRGCENCTLACPASVLH